MSFIRRLLFISFVVSCMELFVSCLRTLPANNLILYKYEGNFYPMYATESPQQAQGHPSQVIISPVHLDQQIYHVYQEEEQVPIATIHVPPSKRIAPRGTVNGGATDVRKQPAASGPQQEVPATRDIITRQYHDIFLKLKSPHELVFGHVLNWPESAEKKVEKRTGNNYKGQVVWADRKGGYGEHYWDLAQGAL